MAALISFLVEIIVAIIGATGYLGVFLLMFVESCGIPMPSEVIMPFAGFLVYGGHMNLWVVACIGALGNLGGSLLSYWIGLRGGRPLLDKYGKYFLISRHDLDIADRWFSHRGEVIVFVGRLLPVIRTYISFPAGISKMSIKKFSLYTFAGALPWSFLFTWLGVKMGSHWLTIKERLHNFDLAIASIVVIVIAAYIYRHLRNKQRYA